MTADRPADDLGPFVTNAFGDRYLPTVVGPVFRDRPARDVYDERFSDTPFEEHSLYVVCGTDSGLFPKYLKEMKVPEGTRFLLIEDPATLKRLKKERLLENDDEHIVVTTLDEFDRAASALELDKHFYRKTLYLVPAFCSIDPNNIRYADLAWQATQKLNTLWLHLGVKLQNRQFLIRIIENVAENRVSIEALEGIFNKRTALLLGGGPSLDDILPWLAENRDRVVVLAVSRISRQLLAAGIVPDLVFSIDPQPVSYELSKDMLRFGEDTLFVNNTHVATGLLAQWTGRSVYWGPRLPWLPWDHPMPGSTVTHLGLWTAIHMGFSRVVLGGVDLCFSREGYTHARGSVERDAGQALQRGLVQVQTNDGGSAETDRQMSIGIEEMGRLAALAARKGCRVVNSAAAAALIPNVEYMPVQQIALPDIPVRPRETIVETLPPDTRETRLDHYRKAVSDLDQALAQLREIQKIATRALKENDRLAKATTRSVYDRARRRIDAAEQRLRTTYKRFRQALMQMDGPAWVGVLRPDKDRWTAEEVADAGRQIFELYRDSARGLAEIVREGRERVLSRIEEEGEGIDDLDILLTRWTREGHPGRVRVWMARNPDAAARARRVQPHAARVEEVCKQFKEHLDAPPQLPFEFKAAETTEKVVAAFQRRDVDALARLVEGLTKRTEPGADAIAALARGFLSELTGDLDTALAHHSQVPGASDEELQVEALKRVVAIQLERRRLPEALQALEQLSNLSPVFRPQYANVLRIAGNARKALDVYLAHLAQHPEDVESMLNLGKLQMDLGVPAAARLAFQHVLTKAPRHATAQALLVEAEKRLRAGGRSF